MNAQSILPILRSTRRAMLGLSLLMTALAGCGGGSQPSSTKANGTGPAAGPASVVEAPAPTKPNQPKVDLQ